ncbi:RNA polymerase sigma-70 factor, ECF subfamily [Tenacibaculum sp. 190524A05c]|uniref:sigma-70 family RNA polymerase sigma factor n=1 Tax=Tenacibaculum platacis TaxID=3137852 RepID=UPI0031FAA4F7
MKDSFYRKLRVYAYNIIGIYDDANDIVQDVLEKFIKVEKSGIDNEEAYLIRMVINSSINFKKRMKKFSAYGTWLPEPVQTDSADSMLERELIADYALMVLFEKLNPKERAVFILKEGFDYKHHEIAEVLDITDANSRKLLGRAKLKLGNGVFVGRQMKRHDISPFLKALNSSDINKLESLFSENISFSADGGDSVQVVATNTIGKSNISKLLVIIYKNFLNDKSYKISVMNHQVSIIYKSQERTNSCLLFSFNNEGYIESIYSVVDPFKLTNF